MLEDALGIKQWQLGISMTRTQCLETNFKTQQLGRLTPIYVQGVGRDTVWLSYDDVCLDRFLVAILKGDD